ncbi:MAG: class I SAM-dependent methyltransferase [Desulfobacteraceae bacterium]|nr:class I SAM-dependent methyltransferase [Desulfobacteraceae bacterium]
MCMQRIPETDHGITGQVTVQMYDKMMKSHRDRGWLSTNDIIASGINRGTALEIGPGPGYLGLEWLKKTDNTKIVALDISQDMIDIAKNNTKIYQMESRVEFIHSDGKDINFKANTFDAVFTSGSLHEWADPVTIINHIIRVLKPGGKFFISDLKRDISWIVKGFMRLTIKPKAMKPGLITSINAAYTKKEVTQLLQKTNIQSFNIKSSLFGLDISGKK